MTARAGGAASLRREVRAARRALPPGERLAADRRIRAGIRGLAEFRSARHVALFFPFDGEPDLTPLISHGQRRRFYAPVISAAGMQFAALKPATALAPNAFGILEPTVPEFIDPRSLDLVLTPLVAFDGRGTRLGVGAGFYDRCFRFLRNRLVWRKPKLVGCAYRLQRREPIEANPWDVPLWAAVTEDGCERFH